MTDSCHDTSADSAKPACACRCGEWGRFLPYIFLIAAALLYGHSILKKREHGEIAKIIRYQASQPFSQVLVVYRPEGRSVNVPRVLPCRPNVATNLMNEIAKAVPTSPFKGVVEGTECEIIVIHADGKRSAFKAARLDKDPQTLYVGTMLPENVNNTNASEGVRVRLSTPAKVKNAGPILGQVIDEIIAIDSRLPPDADEKILEEANANLQRSIEQGAAKDALE